MNEAASPIEKTNLRPTLRRAFWIVLLSIVLGSPMGGLIFGIVSGVLVIATSTNSLDRGTALSLTIVWTPFFALLGYIFGSAPAFVAGTLLAVLDWKLPEKFSRVAIAAACGALSSMLALVVFAAIKRPDLSAPYFHSQFPTLATIAISALLGGTTACCSALLLTVFGAFGPKRGPRAAMRAGPIGEIDS